MLSFVPCDRGNINRIVCGPEGGGGSELRCIPFVLSVGPTTEYTIQICIHCTCYEYIKRYIRYARGTDY